MLVPTNHPTEIDLNLLTTISDCMLLRSSPDFATSGRADFARHLDSIRDSLTAKPEPPVKVPRTPDSSVIRTHDIESLAFFRDFSEQELEASSAYPSTLHIQIQFTLTLPGATRVLLQLRDSKHEETVAACRDVYVPPNSSECMSVNFLNIPTSLIQDLYLMIRAAPSSIKSPRSWVSEYAGITIYPFSPSMADGRPHSIPVPFWVNSEGSPLDVPKMIFQSSRALAPSQTMSESLTVTATITESRAPSSNVSNPPDVPTIGYPVSMSPDYKANSYFVRIWKLQHKTKLKRTRIALRVLDTSQGKFVKIFKNTLNPREYVTVVQKGFLDLDIDEVAELDFDSAKFHPRQSYLIFEVQRSSDDFRVSSFAMVPLAAGSGVILEYPEKKTLTLSKPIKADMKAEHYMDVVRSGTDAAGYGGELLVTGTLQSTECTSNDAVHRLIKWRDSADAVKNEGRILAGLADVQTPVICVHWKKLLRSFAELIASGDPQLKATAISVLTTTLVNVQNDQSYVKIFRVFFGSSLEPEFLASHRIFATTADQVLGFITSVLPKDGKLALDEAAESKCRACCECLPYLLRIVMGSLARKAESAAGGAPTDFKGAVADIFERLAVVMWHPSPALALARDVVCRVIPLQELRAIVMTFCTDTEADDLLFKFLQTFTRPWPDPVLFGRHATALVNGICRAKYFESVATATRLLPSIVSVLGRVEDDASR
jgi:hypothetical protein